MRLVTWNCCRGGLSRKAPLLEPLAPDIAVIQEVAKPAAESDRCLWFGDNPRQGIAVTSAGPYTIRALPRKARVPKFVFPVEVMGPERFTLLAVWAKGGQRFRYVTGVVRALRTYRRLLEGTQTVVIGDLNSNAIWDRSYPSVSNHSAMVQLLSDVGLVSTYHHFFREAQGEETRPTCYLLWKRDRPYHIDYCFVPTSWVTRMRYVEVGSFDAWKQHSDHRPLWVDFAPSETAPIEGRSSSLGTP